MSVSIGEGVYDMRCVNGDRLAIDVDRVLRPILLGDRIERLVVVIVERRHIDVAGRISNPNLFG